MWALAEGLARRASLAAAAATFAVIFVPFLCSAMRHRDGAGLHRVRIGYRYAGLAFGCLVFVTTMTNV